MIHSCDTCAALQGYKTRCSNPEGNHCRHCGKYIECLWSAHDLSDPDHVFLSAVLVLAVAFLVRWLIY